MTVNRFEALTLGAEKTLYRVARAMLKTDEDAADAVQDAILIAFEKRDTLREEAYFSTWLVRILINVCKKYLKSRAREAPARQIMPDLPTADPDPADSIAVRDAVNKLPVKCRLVAVLYYAEEKSVREIASLLSIPPGTVKSRLSRARELLRLDLTE